MGIFVSDSFLKRLGDLRSWKILASGRAGRLELKRFEGLVRIFVVYLDPSSQSQ